MNIIFCHLRDYTGRSKEVVQLDQEQTVSVPDDVPFLGVHFTPSADQSPVITIGPTATPAWEEELQGTSVRIRNSSH